MKKRRTFLSLLTLLAFSIVWGGCSSLHVTSDYNPNYDFSRLKKAAILYPKVEDDAITLTQQRIAEAIGRTLRQKGFEITDKSKADFYVLFHVSITEKRQVITDYQTVGLYPYRPFYGYAVVPVEREYSWREGQFIIDAVDPNGNKIFWRAMATDRLKEFKTPKERIAYIDKVVADVLADFPPNKEQR